MLGEKKKSKTLKWPQKFLNYVLQWYLTGDQKKIWIYFWKLENQIKGAKWKKSDITLNISKNFTTIFDHQLDVTEEHN